MGKWWPRGAIQASCGNSEETGLMSKQQLYYDDVQVGDALPPLVKNPTTRQLVQYAGASGDYYEIHYDHHFAVRSGLKDGVIVHGLLTAGWLAQLMTDWLPSPLALKKFG